MEAPGVEPESEHPGEPVTTPEPANECPSKPVRPLVLIAVDDQALLVKIFFMSFLFPEDPVAHASSAVADFVVRVLATAGSELLAAETTLTDLIDLVEKLVDHVPP